MFGNICNRGYVYVCMNNSDYNNCDKWIKTMAAPKWEKLLMKCKIQYHSGRTEWVKKVCPVKRVFSGKDGSLLQASKSYI